MKKYLMLTILAVLILMLASAWMVHAEILPPYGEGQIGLQAVVLCETLTVREQPSTSSKAVKTLHYGDRIIVQPETGGWAGCFLSDSVDGGRAGWVNEDYLAIDPAWYRTEDNTPVYAWNDLSAPRVALLEKNITLPILKNEGNWLVVSLRGAAGWIYVENSAAGNPDGKRFEASIMIEGMEETVRYEHAVNETMGIEIDYDYERFERRSASDCEWFIPRYENPEAPQNVLELRYSAENADAAAASIGAELSKTYEIIQELCTLDGAGSCIQIDASCVKGTNLMADHLQTVYIIPAAEGCIVAVARCTIESSEGFGVRISNMMNTLRFINGQME